MSVQLSVDVRNAILDAIEATIGVSPILELRTGAQPANAAAGDTGTVVASMTLPADWLALAAAGSKIMAGSWSDSAADATATPAHFRLKTSGGVCKMQGSVTATGGGGDVTLDDITVTAGQVVTITSFALNAPNA